MNISSNTGGDFCSFLEAFKARPETCFAFEEGGTIAASATECALAFFQSQELLDRIDWEKL